MGPVAILILLELTLQFGQKIMLMVISICRNPYFIGINSAIYKAILQDLRSESRNPYFIGINSAINRFSKRKIRNHRSQSLFYWN